MKKFEISIITVVKNAEDTIQRCINSVLTQDFTSFEYILQDGQSTDSTLEIISKFKDNRIRVYSQKDKSIYHAMNLALNKAKGKYVLFLNADDYFYSNRSLYTLYKTIVEEDLDFVCGNALVVRNQESWVWEHKTFTEYDFICGNPCNHQALLVKTQVLKNLGGFQEKYKYAADVYFMFQLIESKAKGKCIEDIISVYSFLGLSSSHPDEGISELMEIMCKFSKLTEDTQKMRSIHKMLGEKQYLDIDLIKYILQNIRWKEVQLYKFFINDICQLFEVKIGNLNNEISNLNNEINFQSHGIKKLFSNWKKISFLLIKRIFIRIKNLFLS